MSPVSPSNSAKKKGKPPLRGPEKPLAHDSAHTEEKPREERRENAAHGLPLFLQRANASPQPHAAGAARTPLPDRIRSAASHGGERLPSYLQHAFGQRLGADASRVRIHRGPEADGLSREVRARAFTTGRDIFFRSGEYRPNDRAGVELLAHEVVHTEQQRQGAVATQASADGVALSQPSDRFEGEADRAAQTFIAGGSHTGRITSAGSGAPVQRKCACDSSGAPCAKCEEEKKLPVQRRAEGAGAPAGSVEMSPGYHSQYAAGAGMFIQRQNIDHRDVDWTDFQKKEPKGAKFDAETFSDIADPALAGAMPTALNPVSTGEPCKVGKKDDTKYKVNIAIDPAKIVVKSFMAQGKSWHKAWVTDPAARRAKCLAEFSPKCEKSFDAQFKQAKLERGKEVKACQKNFDDAAKQVATDCAKQVADCKDAFKQPGTTSFGSATKSSECSTVFLKDCKTDAMSTVSYSNGGANAAKRSDCAKSFGDAFEKALKDAASWKGSMSGASTTVTSRDDCRKPAFLDPCADDLMKAGSESLLSHEQGHFDLTDDMAIKGQADLRAMVAKFPKEVEACGEKAAKSLAKSTLSKELSQLNQKLTAVKKDMRKLQDQYDAETTHGTVEAKQAEWKKRIKKGFIPSTP